MKKYFWWKMLVMKVFLWWNFFEDNTRFQNPEGVPRASHRTNKGWTKNLVFNIGYQKFYTPQLCVESCVLAVCFQLMQSGSRSRTSEAILHTGPCNSSWHLLPQYFPPLLKGRFTPHKKIVSEVFGLVCLFFIHSEKYLYFLI